MKIKNVLLLAVILFFSLFLITSVFASGGPEMAKLPPDADSALQQIETSPRHGEWAMIDAGMGDKVKTWVVYPERGDKAPVVIVVHEIYGLTDWARGVADQLAAEGFIALAPDFLSGKGPDGGATDSIPPDKVRDYIRSLDPVEINKRIDAVAAYGRDLPAAQKNLGVVGFCWGGAVSFGYAAHNNTTLSAAVVYYGTSPETATLANVKAPVLGLYGGEDARVGATIPDAEKELMRLGKRFEKEIYDGAGHAFLRQLDGQDGANLKAAEAAWPRTLQFFRDTIGK